MKKHRDTVIPAEQVVTKETSGASYAFKQNKHIINNLKLYFNHYSKTMMNVNPMKRSNHARKKKVHDTKDSGRSSNNDTDTSKNPYIIFKKAMKEEAKREEKHRRNQEKKQKNTAVLVKKKNPYTTYEVVMKPKDPRNAFEHYLDNNKNIKCLETRYQKQQWKKLSVEDKVYYENLALEDRLRFQNDLKVYKKTMKVKEEQEFDEDVGNRQKKSIRKKFSWRKKST